MFSLNDTMRYYLCPGPTCMRKGINGLCGVVHEQMGCNVKNGDVFIFINKDRKLMKLLHTKEAATEQIENDVIAKMPYIIHPNPLEKPESSKLLPLLPHRWIQVHPEARLDASNQ